MTGSYRGKVWDELEEGQTFWSSGRTITEHDVAAFSALSGDFNPLHVDDEVGKQSVFGERVPHGPLGLMLTLGGYDRIGLVEGVAVAFLSVNWRFLRPMRIGDTVRTKVTIADLKETKHADRGVMTMFVQLFNQRDEAVQEGEHTFIIRRRGAAEA